MNKDIDVPLTWEEIDIISLSLTNKTLKEKMNNYGRKAKYIRTKKIKGCKDDCAYLIRANHDCPCNICGTDNLCFYESKKMDT